MLQTLNNKIFDLRASNRSGDNLSIPSGESVPERLKRASERIYHINVIKKKKMSKAKNKICSVHDLQSRVSDVIFTKKDCDLICDALWEKISVMKKYVPEKKKDIEEMRKLAMRLHALTMRGKGGFRC